MPFPAYLSTKVSKLFSTSGELILGLVAIGASAAAISEASHFTAELNPIVAGGRGGGIVQGEVNLCRDSRLW